jgi:predicted membrane-bound mannosyltransferase
MQRILQILFSLILLILLWIKKKTSVLKNFFLYLTKKKIETILLLLSCAFLIMKSVLLYFSRQSCWMCMVDQSMILTRVMLWLLKIIRYHDPCRVKLLTFLLFSLIKKTKIKLENLLIRFVATIWYGIKDDISHLWTR